MNDLGAEFLHRVQRAAQQLADVDEEQAQQPARAGGWARKQELGHLLDSAQNNHQRIVVTAVEGLYDGPGYDQNAWVDLHGYDVFRWPDLCSFWLARNRMLGHLIGRLSDRQLAAPVRVGEDGDVTLEALIVDYLRHLEHHVAQITAALAMDG